MLEGQVEEQPLLPPEPAVEAAIAVPLLMPAFRRRQISAPLLRMFAKVTPKLSDTEQTALEARITSYNVCYTKLLRTRISELRRFDIRFTKNAVAEATAFLFPVSPARRAQ